MTFAVKNIYRMVVEMDKRKDDLLKMTKAEYMDLYREKIVEMIGRIEDIDYLVSAD